MYNYFTNKIEAFDVEMGNSSSELIDYFLKRSQRGTAAIVGDNLHVGRQVAAPPIAKRLRRHVLNEDNGFSRLNEGFVGDCGGLRNGVVVVIYAIAMQVDGKIPKIAQLKPITMSRRVAVAVVRAFTGHVLRDNELGEGCD